MATLTLSTITGTVLVNSSTVAGVITLPSIQELPGRGLVVIPSAYASTITLLPGASQEFQTGNIRQLADSNDIAHVVGGRDGKWYELQGGLFPHVGITSSISTQVILTESTITSQLSTPIQAQIQTQGLLPPFTPLQIPGLFQWLDANDTSSVSPNYVSSITNATNQVFVWQDKSPMKNDCFLYPGTSPLIWDNGVLNGDGSRSVKTYKQIPFPTEAFTLFIAANHFSDGGLNASFEGIPENTLFIGMSNNTASVAGGNTTIWNTSSFTVIPDESIANTWKLLECQASNGFFKPFVNGYPKQATPFTISSFSEWAIGGYTPTGGRFYGDIGEIILFSTAISEADRERVEAYLATKWSITGLPSNNPNIPVVASAPFTLPTFSPSTLSSLFFWASAEDLQDLPDGAPVYCWSNRMDLTFSASTLAAPWYSKTNKALYFDRQYRALKLDKTRLPAGSNPYHIVAVATATSNDLGAVFGYGNYETTNETTALRFNNLNTIYSFWWDNDISIGVTPSFDSPNILATGTSLTASLSETRRVISWNGYNWGSDGPGTHALQSLCNAEIGNAYYNANTYRGSLFNGYIHEFFLFSNALSVSDQESLNGYLAKKYKIQYKLPTVHPDYIPLSSVSQTLSFSPSSISSLTLWLDARDPFANGTLPQDNARVFQWSDKSGKSNHATAPLSNVAPFYGTAPRYNASCNSIRFYSDSNASRNYIETTWYRLPNETLPYLNNPYTIFFVGSYSADKQEPEQANSILTGGTMYTATAKFFLSMGAPTWTVHGYIDDGTTALFYGTPQPNSNTLFGFSFEGNTRYVDAYTNAYMNGVLMAKTPSITYVAQQSFSNFLGRYGNFQGINNQFDGNLQEVLVFQSLLTPQDRQRVEGYLAHKWNLQLPNGHPYRATAPTSTAPVLPSTFVPSDFPGLKVWLDATDSNTLTLTTSTIQQWQDKSPCSTLFFIPQDPGTELQISTSVLFNQPMAAFNQFTFLYTSTLSSMNVIPYSYFMVSKQMAGGTSNGILSFSHNGCNDSYTTAYTFETEIQRQYQNNTLFMATTANPWGIYEAIETTRANQNFGYGPYRINGGFSNSIATTSAPDFNVPFSTLCIGARLLSNTIVTGSNFGANFYMGEFLLYGTDLPLHTAQQVEGYLAWKWGLENSLPTFHPWRNSPPSYLPRPPFTPLQLGAPTCWFDASQPTTIFSDSNATTPITNNQAVQAWLSRSNAGFSTIQDTPSYTPLYLSNALSNRPGVVFAAEQTLYAETASIGALSNSTQMSIYTVITISQSNADFIPVSQWYTHLGVQTAPQRYVGVTRANSQVAVYANDAFAFATGQPCPPPNTTFILGFTSAFPLDLGTLITQSNSFSFGPFNFISQGTMDFLLGYPGPGVATGIIHEVITYPKALAPPDQRRLEGYLAWKWGLQADLPAGHPYKSKAP